VDVTRSASGASAGTGHSVDVTRSASGASAGTGFTAPATNARVRIDPLAAMDAHALQAQDKARVLREALPWINRWSGRTVVVKYGGNSMSPSVDASFAGDVALLRAVGIRVVVVHGGGPQISALSQRLGLQPTFAGGRRVTDEMTLEAVRLALLGDVNPRLVGLLASAGATAVGVAGTDANLLTLSPVPQLGLVGDVEAVDPSVLTSLLDDGVVPVVAGLGRDREGQVRNVNADAVAAAVAVALDADKLLYLSDVPGLYERFGTPDSELVSVVTLGRLRDLVDSGDIADGMVPKISGVVAALDGGVRQCHLLDGRIEHALLLEIFTDEGIGTMVVPE
jgi:acetylglutamate kinase